MAQDATTYLRDRWLNDLKNNTPHVGLLTSAGAEFTAASYHRKPISFGSPIDASPTGRQIVQSAEVLFDQAEEDWGTAAKLGIFNAASGGSMIASHKFDGDAAFPIATGQQFKLPNGQVKVVVA